MDELLSKGTSTTFVAKRMEGQEAAAKKRQRWWVAKPHYYYNLQLIGLLLLHQFSCSSHPENGLFDM